MANMWNDIDFGLVWFANWLSDPKNTENLLLIFLIIGTVLTPITIYRLERSRIPKLKFGGFIKVDSSDWRLAFSGQDRMGFFIKVTNTNRRSEGNMECFGFVTIGNKTYRTVWEYGYAGTPIGREALLLVFYIDKNTKKLFFGVDGHMDDNVAISIECSRGRCPKPLTKSIKHIIDSATNV